MSVFHCPTALMDQKDRPFGPAPAAFQDHEFCLEQQQVLAVEMVCLHCSNR